MLLQWLVFDFISTSAMFGMDDHLVSLSLRRFWLKADPMSFLHDYPQADVPSAPISRSLGTGFGTPAVEISDMK